MAGHLKATTSFAGASLVPGHETDQVDVVEGRTYRENHPAVFGREHLFEPLDQDDASPAAEIPRRRTSKAE
jgi:hypothetical protein